MIRVSVLRNCPVICEGRKIGLLQSISLDHAQKMVRALIVASGMRGKRMIPSDGILTMTSEFILVDRSEKFRRRLESESLGFVRDTTGRLVGCITDYMIDETTLRIVSFEIMRGYLPGERSTRIWTFSYSMSDRHADEFIVPTDLSSELVDQKEEKQTCAFRP